MPPPSPATLLPLTVPLVTVNVPETLTMPPPELAPLPLTLLSLSVRVPPLTMPPPEVAVLLLRVLFFIDRVPPLTMPPPVDVTTLPVMVLLMTASHADCAL